MPKTVISGTRQLDKANPKARRVARRIRCPKDKTLTVHCMMTGSPFQTENTYQRKGIGTRLAQGLVAWGTAQGWRGIEATAYEGLDILYANTGQAGVPFWERLGFEEEP